MGFQTIVALYALLKTEVQSVERATLWLVEKHDPENSPAIMAGKFKHSFFGYIIEPFNRNDFESHSDLEAPLIEESDMEVCYICLQERSKHADQ